MIESAGLALIYRHKILLVKPQGIKKNNIFSIPKGIIEEDESCLEAAIRETKEETGLTIPKELMDTHNLYKINYINKGGITKILFYYLADISSLSVPEVLPPNQLQRKEVQYAAFFTKEEAKNLIFWRQEPVLYQF
jgi:ADP-ribose pyrophosphatase YjhB (NUDIX family)